MKKTIFRCSIIACALALTSCVDNEENSANAEISYYATCENISFFDENDIVYKEFIEESLDSLKLTGENSIFKQKASVDYGYMGLAVTECNRLATEKYARLIQQYQLEDVKKAIFEKHKNTLGVNSYSEIPIDEFTASLSLRSLYITNADTIKTYKKYFGR